MLAFEFFFVFEARQWIHVDKCGSQQRRYSSRKRGWIFRFDIHFCSGTGSYPPSQTPTEVVREADIYSAISFLELR